MGALTFAALLLKLVTRYGGTKQDLAARVGLSPSQFSRLLSAEAQPTIEICLNLADATSTAATLVLRAARFDRVATQLERLFGSPVAQPQPPCYPLTPRECQHIDQWRALEDREQKAVTIMITAAVGVRSRVPGAPPKRQRTVPVTRSA